VKKIKGRNPEKGSTGYQPRGKINGVEGTSGKNINESSATEELMNFHAL